MKSSLLAAVLAAGLALAGSATAQDAFPATVTHAFGDTVIEARPERILTLSWMSQEAMIALGESPVAIQFQGWGGNEEGYLPWIVEAYEARGEALPPTINTTAGIPFEEILGFEPDLIFTPYSGVSEDDYARLSSIAPTVPYREAPWSGSWQYVVETAGVVLGRPDAAAEVIAATQNRLESYKDTYPVIAGKSFVFGGGASDGSSIGVYIPADPRVGLLSDLGLVPAEGLYALPTDNFTQPVSIENLDSLDADVLVAWYPSQEDVDTLLANPLFARWEPIAAGHFVPLIDRSSVMAVSAPSPLSIPWMMDRFVPALAAALD